MRIGIIGIGGVGGYFGGKLAREYSGKGQHEIVFICRGEHLAAIKKNGLQLFTKEGDYIARPDLVTNDPAEAGLFDLVLFCVKSYALESSAKLFQGAIKKDAVVIPLLNGVNSGERLRSILPQADVLSGSTYIISHIEKPGVVRQEGASCKLIFGTDDRESAQKHTYILDFLLKAGIKAVLTEKISETLWTKYLLMCPMASITTATGKTYGAVREDPVLRKMARDLMEEVVAVAQAHHIYLPESEVDKAMELVAGFDYNSKTSMQLDQEKGKRTEVDIMTAYLCRAGRESGVPTPLHDKLYQQILRL